jgi:DNA-nicking Smr family endonuclease|tara:strand:- start:39833 stop:40375 length:543 start_codon:yes stop_codon:yes gene_type:complete
MANRDDDENKDASFAEMMGDIKLITSDRVISNKPKPYPTPRQRDLDEQRVLVELSHPMIEDEDMQAGDVLSYCQPGIQKQVFRKLKRGQYSINTELDLHGLTRAEAEVELIDFIDYALTENIRCVRIIHGKGLSSNNNGPVIKPLVNRWLRRRNDILAFCSARPVDGGTGAVYVLLRSKH